MFWFSVLGMGVVIVLCSWAIISYGSYLAAAFNGVHDGPKPCPRNRNYTIDAFCVLPGVWIVTVRDFSILVRRAEFAYSAWRSYRDRRVLELPEDQRARAWLTLPEDEEERRLSRLQTAAENHLHYPHRWSLSRLPIIYRRLGFGLFWPSDIGYAVPVRKWLEPILCRRRSGKRLLAKVDKLIGFTDEH